MGLISSIFRRKKTIKVSGGHTHDVFLEQEAGRIMKKYKGERSGKSMSQEEIFSKFSPYAPRVVGTDEDKKRLYTEYIPGARMLTFDYLLKKNIASNIGRALRITHKRKKMFFRSLSGKEKESAQKFDYIFQLKKIIKDIDDMQFVLRIKRDLIKFDVLNDKKDFALIHGDLWLNNILLKGDIYFIDAERPETKGNMSIGNKYIDIGFLISQSMLKRSYYIQVIEGKNIQTKKLRKAINDFVSNYFFGKNLLVHRRLLTAMSFCFIKRARSWDVKKNSQRRELTEQEEKFREFDKEMALVCLDVAKLDNVLDYFFKYYIP
jgi:aminoglycoside phosphotransferase